MRRVHIRLGGMDEAVLFESVIDAISNDRFLMFIEQFTHALISPLSTRYLRWCREVDDENTAEQPQQGSSIDHFSPQHFEAFQTYQALFESRIVSVLKKVSRPDGAGTVSPELFFAMCEKIISEKPESATSRLIASEMANLCVRDGSRIPSSEQGHVVITLVDLCETLLDMVHSVSSFDTFAAMLAERQQKLVSADADTETDDAVGET
jgi:hypothetical protein